MLPQAEVLNFLLQSNTTKRAGADSIPNMFLKKYSEPRCTRYLTVIFQKSLESHTEPVIWKMANVVLIYKSGKKNAFQLQTHLLTIAKYYNT